MDTCIYEIVDVRQYELRDFLKSKGIEFIQGYPDKNHSVKFTIQAPKNEVVDLLKQAGFSIVDFFGEERVRDPWVLTTHEIVDKLCELRADARGGVLSMRVDDNDKLILPDPKVIDKYVDTITSIINSIEHHEISVREAAYNKGYRDGYEEGLHKGNSISGGVEQ